MKHEKWNAFAKVTSEMLELHFEISLAFYDLQWHHRPVLLETCAKEAEMWEPRAIGPNSPWIGDAELCLATFSVLPRFSCQFPKHPRIGFLTLGTIDIWEATFLLREGCPIHIAGWSAVTGNPGLSAQDASGSPYPAVTTKNASRYSRCP